MYFSRPSMHPPVIATPEHRDAAETQFESIATVKPRVVGAGVLPDSFDIPLTTVSLNGNFDAYIDVAFPGATTAPVQLMVDSGNSVLIVPRWEDLQGLPDYQVLGVSQEPWRCPANVVRGPINLVTTSGDTYTLENCVFYACTGDDPDGNRTANFGAGCLSPWTETPPGIDVTMQAPLTYNTDYPYAEFDYAPSTSIHGAANVTRVAAGSFLKLSKTKPSGYAVFDIIPNLDWMSLIPKSLSIGNTRTQWPGTVPAPIAMIDTGGGPVFLSDPNGYIYTSKWPDPVTNPGWTSQSVDCQSTSDAISIEIGDSNGSFSYSIEPSDLPPAAQGLSLVMCRLNSYMMDQQGMNIGGISALVNYILVDYKACQVGLRSK